MAWYRSNDLATGAIRWERNRKSPLLALIVLVLVRSCGDRLTAQWRFLLWGVVLARLLLVATPGSNWSVFNLARWNTGSDLHRSSVGDDVSLDVTEPAEKTMVANRVGKDKKGLRLVGTIWRLELQLYPRAFCSVGSARTSDRSSPLAGELAW